MSTFLQHQNEGRHLAEPREESLAAVSRRCPAACSWSMCSLPAGPHSTQGLASLSPPADEEGGGGRFILCRWCLPGGIVSVSFPLIGTKQPDMHNLEEERCVSTCGFRSSVRGSSVSRQKHGGLGTEKGRCSPMAARKQGTEGEPDRKGPRTRYGSKTTSHTPPRHSQECALEARPLAGS